MINYDYNRHKSYPKLSQEPTIEKIHAIMSNFNYVNVIDCYDNNSYSFENVMKSLRNTCNNYCDTSEIAVDCFYFNWPHSDCNKYLTALALENHKNVVDNDLEFPAMMTINKIASSLHVLNDPFAEEEDNFYFDYNGLLKIARTVRLTDPCDENDDGVEILMYEGMDDRKFDDIIHEFFYYAYIKHMGDLPEELRKPITKMTEDEYQVFMMYVI